MSAAMPSSTGNVRSARKMPPMPSVSAIVWRSPKLGRDLEVAHGGRVHADLDRVDDEVGAVQRGPPVEAGGDRRGGAELVGGAPGDRLGRLQPLGVDVVQRQRDVAQLGEADRMSASSSRVNTTLPAPRKAISGHGARILWRRSRTNAQENLAISLANELLDCAFVSVVSME